MESASSWLSFATIVERTLTLRGCGRSAVTSPYFWISFAWACQLGVVKSFDFLFALLSFDAMLHLFNSKLDATAKGAVDFASSKYRGPSLRSGMTAQNNQPQRHFTRRSKADPDKSIKITRPRNYWAVCRLSVDRIEVIRKV